MPVSEQPPALLAGDFLDDAQAAEGVEGGADWEGWLAFFLDGIAQTAEAPADARFQGNLARLQAAMSGPMRYAQAPASLARVAVAWPAIGLARPLRQFIDPSSGTTVRIEAPTPQIVRISAREVFLAAPQRGDADPRRRNPNYRQALAR